MGLVIPWHVLGEHDNHYTMETPWHVESSRARDQTYVPRSGRQILIHCTTREIQEALLLKHFQNVIK